MRKSLNVAVLGAGAFGTALSCVAVRNGHQTILWARNQAHVDAINATYKNERYLPGIKLPSMLCITADFEKAVNSADIVLLATPAQTIGGMISSIDRHIHPQQPIILCAKGIGQETGRTPAQTLHHNLPDQNLAALSGPSFARDIAANLPTAVTLAHKDRDEATRLAEAVSGANFRVYASGDITGVELGGALKNVIALAVGVCRGMGLGASAEAALISRGFAELSRLAVCLGANPQTLMGLSGLGDLVLTCSGPQSRNFSYGMTLGKSRDRSGLALAEGAHTASIAAKLAKENQIDAPIISMVAKLVADAITPQAALRELLNRPLKPESEQ